MDANGMSHRPQRQHCAGKRLSHRVWSLLIGMSHLCDNTVAGLAHAERPSLDQPSCISALILFEHVSRVSGTV